MRRVIAVTCAAMPLALLVAMASCSSVPSYVVAGDGSLDPLADASLVDETATDGSSASDAVTFSDGRTCFTKKSGDHFRFFMTDRTVPGNLHARDAGDRPDDICKKAAMPHWPSTHWKAYYWAAASQHPSKQLVEPCDGWWTPVLGIGDVLVFPNIASLYDKPLADIRYTEQGDLVSSGAMQVWTGGDQLNVLSQGRCGNWDDVSKQGTTGWAADPARWMKDLADRGCTALGHLYCIEVP